MKFEQTGRSNLQGFSYSGKRKSWSPSENFARNQAGSQSFKVGTTIWNGRTSETLNLETLKPAVERLPKGLRLVNLKRGRFARSRRRGRRPGKPRLYGKSEYASKFCKRIPAHVGVTARVCRKCGPTKEEIEIEESDTVVIGGLRTHGFGFGPIEFQPLHLERRCRHRHRPRRSGWLCREFSVCRGRRRHELQPHVRR